MTWFCGGLEENRQRQESKHHGDVWVRRVDRFPNRRPIRRAQDGAPGRLGLCGGEQATARATADPCGMTNKEQATATAKAKANTGVLRCAQNDERLGWLRRTRKGKGNDKSRSLRDDKQRTSNANGGQRAGASGVRVILVYRLLFGSELFYHAGGMDCSLLG
jgi:hypothetical protein